MLGNRIVFLEFGSSTTGISFIFIYDVWINLPKYELSWAKSVQVPIIYDRNLKINPDFYTDDSRSHFLYHNIDYLFFYMPPPLSR